MLMYAGNLITESLRPGTVLDTVRIAVGKITTIDHANATAEQPSRWTILGFEIDDDDADRLADWLAGSLVADPSVWYCDYHNQVEHFVIFPGRIFRYRIGDRDERAKVIDYGRMIGVPESQLDWGD
jgi:hypothetical protein